MAAARASRRRRPERAPRLGDRTRRRSSLSEHADSATSERRRSGACATCARVVGYGGQGNGQPSADRYTVRYRPAEAPGLIVRTTRIAARSGLPDATRGGSAGAGVLLAEALELLRRRSGRRRLLIGGRVLRRGRRSVGAVVPPLVSVRGRRRGGAARCPVSAVVVRSRRRPRRRWRRRRRPRSRRRSTPAAPSSLSLGTVSAGGGAGHLVGRDLAAAAAGGEQRQDGEQ